jgi:hypothetical protein
MIGSKAGARRGPDPNALCTPSVIQSLQSQQWSGGGGKPPSWRRHKRGGSIILGYFHRPRVELPNTTNLSENFPNIRRRVESRLKARTVPA